MNIILFLLYKIIHELFCLVSWFHFPQQFSSKGQTLSVGPYTQALGNLDWVWRAIRELAIMSPRWPSFALMRRCSHSLLGISDRDLISCLDAEKWINLPEMHTSYLHSNARRTKMISLTLSGSHVTVKSVWFVTVGNCLLRQQQEELRWVSNYPTVSG